MVKKDHEATLKPCREMPAEERRLLEARTREVETILQALGMPCVRILMPAELRRMTPEELGAIDMGKTRTQ